MPKHKNLALHYPKRLKTHIVSDEERLEAARIIKGLPKSLRSRDIATLLGIQGYYVSYVRNNTIRDDGSHMAPVAAVKAVLRWGSHG
jgi:hypothetical protein